MAGVATIGVLAMAGGASAGESEDLGAVDDLYNTPFQTAVVLDSPAPSDNDVPDVESDFVFTEVLSQPSSGTLSAANGDEADGATYTPNAGFTGTDSFTYLLVWGFEFEVPRSIEELGDFDCFQGEGGFFCESEATVFIEVGAPAPTTTVTAAQVTTTTAAPATVPPTTVAAAAQLPATGANGQLIAIGVGVAVLGLGALLLSRRGQSA